MNKRIVIVGGGAVGCSIAYFLTKDGKRQFDVTVVERDPSYTIASSALSASSIRQQFNTPECVQLSQFGYEFLDSIEREKERWEGGVELKPCGYLFLAGQGEATHLRDRTAMVRNLGVQTEEFDADRLKARYPWLATDGLVYGVRGTHGEGWFDGYSLLQWFKKRAKEAGVTFVHGNANRYMLDGSRIKSLELADGSVITGDEFVTTGGAWSAKLTNTFGIDVPIRPRRRTAFVMSSPAKFDDFPILMTETGIYVRREQQHFLAVISPSPEKDLDGLPLEPDFSEFDEIIWPGLAERIPAFEALRIEHVWAGYYEYNTLDQNGIVGHIGPDNSYIAAGFSGHGMMHSPGTGRAVAELLTHGQYQSVDLTRFSYDRIPEGKLLVEHSIY